MDTHEANAEIVERLETADGMTVGLFREALDIISPDPETEGYGAADWLACHDAWESATLALMREVLPGWKWQLGEEFREGPNAYAMIGSSAPGGYPAIVVNRQRSSAIALLIAILKAKAAEPR